MSVFVIGLIAMAVLLCLIFLSVPVGIALGIVGFFGNTVIVGFNASLVQIGLVGWEGGKNFILIAIPLFVFMGQILFHAGLATDLYDCMHKWFGRLPGGLAVTATAASIAFGSISGSSIITVSTMGAMAMPELRRFGYSPRLSTGSIASAGCLAILLPPSIQLVIYGVWTETSISALFAAGLFPKLITMTLFCVYIFGLCWLKPSMGPAGPSYPWPVRISSLVKLLPIALLFAIVLGGIYAGVFTPSEASGIGAVGAAAITFGMRRLTMKALTAALSETVSVSAMVFTIILGGTLFSRFMVQTEVTPSLVALIAGLDVNRYVIILCFVVLYVVLGCLLDTLAMMILTLPFVVPVIVSLGFDKIWFGIFIAMMMELGLIHPPVGLNIYVMKRVAPDVSIRDIFMGCLPFIGIVLLVVALLTAFPGIAMWLPTKMHD